MEWHHVTQTRFKTAQVRPDAPETYNEDPYFDFLPRDIRDYGVRCIEAVRGESLIVTQAWHDDGILWYEMHLSPPRIVHDDTGREIPVKFLRIPARYVDVLDPGYLEAR